MVFSSITFLFYFLPLFFALYFITPFKNTVLLFFSLFFYAWGELGYVALMLFSIAMNHAFGILIARKNKHQLLFLSLGITCNLLLLTYYKYFNFLTETVTGTADSAIHLPLGISFFTFQAISYLIDVRRGDAQVEKNVFNLGLYISMFPQLIAGPVVRFKTVASQINNRHSTLEGVHNGIRIFIIGLAQKVLIANPVALPADQIFSLGESELTTALAWLGSLFYSLQIYFDFAGYSNMAIGLGLIIGFTFPENFSHPYVSQSITEFWRRWHKSLSGWFRDYLYIPLGGNRKGKFRTYCNLFIVFLLCGFWHGAAWTFIIWGCYHGFFLVIERLKLNAWLSVTWRPIRHLYLLLVVLFGWVIFRAENFSHLTYYLKAMLGFTNTQNSNPYYLYSYLSNSTLTVVVLGIIFSMPIYKTAQTMAAKFQQKDQLFGSSVIKISFEVFFLFAFALSLSFVASGSYNPFIYFRF